MQWGHKIFFGPRVGSMMEPVKVTLTRADNGSVGHGSTNLDGHVGHGSRMVYLWDGLG